MLRKWTSKIAFMIMAATMAIGTVASDANAQGFWEAVKERGELRCGAALASPWVMKNPKTGEYGGAYLDICKQFAEVLNVKMTFVDTTWDNIIAGLQSGKWDLAPALNRSPQRALAINFSVPAGYDVVSILYPSSSKKIVDPTPDLKTIDVAGNRVGVVAGTAHDQAVTQRFKAAQIVRLPQMAALQLALLSGQVDVAALPSDNSNLFKQAHGDKVTVLEPKPALLKQAIGFGLPRNVEGRDIAVFDIFLEEKAALGQVDALMLHYGRVMTGDADW